MRNRWLKWRYLRYRFKRWWRRVPLRKQAVIMAFLPVIGLALSTTSAIIGRQQRERIETDIQRNFRLVLSLNDLLTLTVNAETALRGFLLTRREEFLRPFQVAGEKIPPTLAQLHEVVEQEPGSRPRVEKRGRLQHIDTLVTKEMSELARLKTRAERQNPSLEDMYGQINRDRELMDQLREEIHVMETEEEKLLDERLEEINAIRSRDYLIIIITLLIGLGIRLVSFKLFDRGVIGRINELVTNVRHLRRGKELPNPPSGKNDALGKLEKQIALAAKHPPPRADAVSASSQKA